ncbi:GDP-mannose transporter gonst3 [Trifolium repens]|nr:GDP-mannose transporter gonst3 [Trifolium repens]
MNVVNENDGNWYNSIVHQISVYGVAAGYCLSASLLSVINKWAVMKFPYPGTLTALQYFTSAAGVLLCGWLKVVEHGKLHLITMCQFLPAAVIFYLALFTNSELLLHANVDTFIVFRSAVPIFVAVGESMFLHRPWPSLKTWASLGIIFAGSVLYVATDYQLTFATYMWAVAYLALLLFPLELLIMGELKKIQHEIIDESDWHSFPVILPVVLSCMFGLAISFFGFSCRRAISATGFTVLGIVNKLLTDIINFVIWDKHSTWIGTIGLLICMLGGVMYQQSTSKLKDAKQVTAKEEEEQLKLLEHGDQFDNSTNSNIGVLLMNKYLLSNYGYRKREAWVTYATLLPVVAGVIIATGGEPSFHLFGFIICVSSTAARAFKSVLQSILLSSEGEKLDSMNLLLYMAPIAMMVLLPATLLMEGNVLRMTIELAREDFRIIWYLLLSSSLAYFVNLTNFLVTKYTSALTLQVLGNAKGVVAVVISILIFQNPISMIGMVGYVLTIIGVILYSETKRRYST